MASISTQGKNFWIAIILNAGICGLGGFGHMYIGQKKKGIIFLVLSLGLWIIGFGWVPAFLSLIDMWMLKDQIMAGAEIDEMDHGLEFLGSLPGFKKE